MMMMMMMMMMMIIFVELLTNERHKAFFPARTIVRDSRHCKSPIWPEQYLHLHGTGVQASLNEVVQ